MIDKSKRDAGAVELALAEGSLRRRQRWAATLGNAAAFLGPLGYVCVSLESGSFRNYIPGFLAWTMVCGGLWILLNWALIPKSERRRDRLREIIRRQTTIRDGAPSDAERAAFQNSR